MSDIIFAVFGAILISLTITYLPIFLYLIANTKPYEEPRPHHKVAFVIFILFTLTFSALFSYLITQEKKSGNKPTALKKAAINCC
ncbi:MAG TPA: hypothetical protein PL155_07360 [Candidatus Omnitrophota bacterium]|nr:hypothetical protein [Candidatus Omnitrophota bacterium]HPD85349.1 hypothetical protein [Candidatus Omnitrophota bacterium]HRZ04150.1 hypothetical protein [Candidatus Omnitrophota bacterium]